jgi:uncharacterized oxidoreductase
MKTSGNTILVTGGATGIGLALAEEFVRAGNSVFICGRREESLKQAKNRIPQVSTLVCDVSLERGRNSLFNYVRSNFVGLNMLVNNAGIQRMIDLKRGVAALKEGEDEIAVNFKAPVYLCAQFMPLLLGKNEAAIVNVSSGLAFVPLAAMPVYCATKAALHSFCLSLRHQLRATPVKVFEVIPPMVDTGLDKGARERRGQADRGIPAFEVAKATIEGLRNNQYEIAVGTAADLMDGSKTNLDQLFQNMNRW